MNTPRYLVTLGTSFCGSTLLDYLLNVAAQEVVSLGETRTILMPPSDQPRDCVPCSYRAAAGEDIGPCWLDEAVETIRQTHVAAQHLYPTLASMCLGAPETLHTSDKSTMWVTRFGLTRLDTAWIVLWKPLAKAFASHKTYHPDRGESQTAISYYQIWSREYDRALTMPGKKFVINYDDLAGHTESVLHALCKHFGFTYNDQWPDQWHRLHLHHRLYGNHGTSARLAKGGTEIYVDMSYRRKLTEADLNDCTIIEQHDPHGTIGRLYEASYLPQ